MSLARLYLSGSVARWHQNPALAHTGQSDADHQGRCVALAARLHPCASANLLRWLATHDVGELDAGDLSFDFKRANTGISQAHAEVEASARVALCGPDPALTLDEFRWAKLIDRLESACWCLHRAPEEYRRAGSGWERAEGRLLILACDLGCGDAVRGLLHDLKGGRW